jgi:glycosyltransferase involved in cell wall biosynthesis
VISCPRGALPEIVEEEVDGFLIRNEAEGAEAVRKIFQIRRESCRKKAEEKFLLSAVLKHYEQIYRGLA